MLTLYGVNCEGIIALGVVMEWNIQWLSATAPDRSGTLTYGVNYVDGVSIMTDWQPLVKRNWFGFETCQNNSASKFTYGVN